MKKYGISTCCAILLLVGCGKEESPPVTTTPPAVTQEKKQPEQEQVVVETTSAQPQEAVGESIEEAKPAVTVEEDEPISDMAPTVTVQSEDPPSHDEIIALANLSGCFACHAIDKKLVGPPWADVARHYQGDASARDMLIEKVKTGGKGSWTEITGGMAMPAYSPRVSDTDIEKLVDFILLL